MNQDQINSLIRTFLKMLGTFLTARGLSHAAGIVNSEDVIGLVMTAVGVIWSHMHHKDDSTPPKSSTGTASMLLLACGLSFPLMGCATTPQQAAYRTAATTQVSVDAAMHEWGAYVASTHPPAAQEEAVAAAYAKYQRAMAVVCDAGAVYAASADQTNVFGSPASLSAALDEAVANANQSITDLENLIVSFGVKLKQ